MASNNSLNLVKHFVKNLTGLQTCLKKIEILRAGGGNCTASFTVNNEHLSKEGCLEGSCATCLVDTVSTCALISNDGIAPGVTTDIHVSFLKSAKPGDTLLINATTMKTSDTLAFVDVVITKQDTGDVIAKGSHTKFVGRS